VTSLCAYDDGLGSGPDLYVGGFFAEAGDVQGTSRIARWTGTSWAVVGGGLQPHVNESTIAMTARNHELFVGGSFVTAGNVLGTRCLAKWNGAQWSSLNAQLALGERVQCLKFHDDGSGEALFIGGWFNGIGTSAATHLARWDGQSFSAVSGPIVTEAGNGPDIRELEEFKGDLFVGGRFSAVGPTVARSLARWPCGDSSTPCSSGWSTAAVPPVPAGGDNEEAGGPR
jgi:trimeric autotransporter adhesin